MGFAKKKINSPYRAQPSLFTFKPIPIFINFTLLNFYDEIKNKKTLLGFIFALSVNNTFAQSCFDTPVGYITGTNNLNGASLAVDDYNNDGIKDIMALNEQSANLCFLAGI